MMEMAANRSEMDRQMRRAGIPRFAIKIGLPSISF
jgi:hypothetical protein